MRKEEFFEVLGELDDDIVKGAKAHMKKNMNWVALGAMAACLAVVVTVGAALPRAAPMGPDPMQSEIEIETEYIKIYYLSEKGTIESKSVELPCVPERIFNEWATLNGISDVTFVASSYDDGGSEKQQGDVTEYTVGSHYTFTLTLSSEFSAYTAREQGDLLVQSLRQTFCGYISIDDFRLSIED